MHILCRCHSSKSSGNKTEVFRTFFLVLHSFVAVQPWKAFSHYLLAVSITFKCFMIYDACGPTISTIHVYMYWSATQAQAHIETHLYSSLFSGAFFYTVIPLAKNSGQYYNIHFDFDKCERVSKWHFDVDIDIDIVCNIFFRGPRPTSTLIHIRATDIQQHGARTAQHTHTICNNVFETFC